MELALLIVFLCFAIPFALLVGIGGGLIFLVWLVGKFD